jgi:uncharacterized membrane protein
MDAYDKALVTMLVCASLFIVFAIPLVVRKVPRNSVYGFRTQATLSNDFVWFEANAHFGRRLLVAAVFSVVAVLVLYYTALSPVIFVYSALAALITPALVAALDTVLYLRALRKADRALPQ